jgi:hypothetical protein
MILASRRAHHQQPHEDSHRALDHHRNSTRTPHAANNGTALITTS